MKSARVLDPDRRTALEAERDFLLRSLEDLERERTAGDLTDEDYQSLHDGYTARAAAALRELESGEAAIAHARVAAKARRSPWRSAAVAASCAVIAVGAGFAVARSAGERVAGQGLTGSIDSISAERARKVAPLMTAARNKMSSDTLGALRDFDAALQLDPSNTEALTYSGWMVRNVARQTDGDQAKELVASALTRIDRAIEIDPRYPDARAFRGIIRLRDLNDPKGAVEDFTVLDAVQSDPMIDQLVGSARAEANDALKEQQASTTVAP